MFLHTHNAVSQYGNDFISFRARMTARECLRHRWLTSNRKSNGASKPVSKPEVISTPDPVRRVGCSSCPPSTNQKNLRKYLSKSREALFEKVISRSKDLPQENLRKSTLMSRYNKTRRMCESQMSLVSKSRERLLMNDQKSMMMSPNLHRSREKLYGLRSLSKSHEVLNLCKTVGGLNSEVKVPESSPLRGILKTLTRATTTDISSLVGVEVKEEGSKSSSTSSLHEKDNDSDRDLVEKISKERENIEKENLCEKLVITKELTVPPEVQPLQSVLTFICKNSTSTEPKDESDDKENVAVGNHKEEILTETGNKINISSEDELKEKKKHRPPPLFTKQLSITQSDEEPMSPETNLDSLSLTGTSTSSSEISEEDAGSLERITYDFSTEDDEPRYTVAQLISAYNLHQEIVTKCSLEVTMSADDLETKIPPILEKAPNQKFPTGPNALRLFIPNIDIASRTVKRTARKKPTMRPAPKKIDEITEEIKDTLINDAEITNSEPADEDITETNISPETKPPQKSTKSTTSTEKPSNSTENRFKLEKSNSKEKCRLTEDVPSRSFVRSSSISSEASFKSSGASSNITTSTEELTTEKKSRSNRSSGIASSDGDHPTETWKSSNQSTGTKASERLAQTTPRPNRKSFCSPRVPAVQPDSKTRRKSSPIMKPFY